MARAFNRGTDKIDMGNNSLLIPSTPNLTFAGWARFDNFSSENWIFTRYNTGAVPGAYLIRTTTGTNLDIFWLDSVFSGHGGTGTTGLSTGTWYHIGGVISGSNGSITSKVYLNGVQDFSQGPVNVNWGTSTLNAMIGASNSGQTMAGRAANWGFWNTPLSTKQLTALAAGASPYMVAPDNLVSFWPLLGDSPEPDYSTNKLVGTVTGATIVPHPKVVPFFFKPEIPTVPPAPGPIVPSNINATSTTSGSVIAFKKLTPASINATSTTSGNVKALRKIAPATISATSTVSGLVRRARSIVPTNILATSTVAGSVYSANLIVGNIMATSMLFEINLIIATVPAGYYGVSDIEDGII